MTLGEIIKTLKRIYCMFHLVECAAISTDNEQAVLLAFSTSISRTRSNATGLENALKSLNHGTIHWKRNA